jgi:histone deacetylase complex subunit SAP18
MLIVLLRRPEAYDNMQDTPLQNELHIYTWPDATLREIADLIQDANEEARNHGRLAVSIVYPDRRGKFVIKKAGIVGGGRKLNGDEDKTLASLGFQNGDYLDVAMLN